MQENAGLRPARLSSMSLTKAAFARCLKVGRSGRGNSVSLSILGNQSNSPRLGMVVPKRIISRAVDRNRIKRIVREWFRARYGEFGGCDLVVRIRKPAPDKPAERVLIEELVRLAPKRPS